MMHGDGESDSVIVAGKPTNKAEQSVAEPVERRTGTKGMRTSKTRTGRRTGPACHLRWTAYGTPQGEGRRRGSLRSSTILLLTSLKRRFPISGRMRHQAWTG